MTTVRNVAVIFDNQPRPETTGLYCRRALGQMLEVEHFLPSDFERLKNEHFDLYLHVDDGLNYSLPETLHPSVYWAIDTHMGFEERLERSRAYDFVFAAQKDGATKLKNMGIESARWLPLACDPILHNKHDLIKQFDLVFIGNLFPGPRMKLVELLRNRFPNMFVGKKYFDDMARTYSQSRIVFNRSIENDINMRVFEALASGSLLLTNDLSANGQTELFKDGEHLALYRDEEELLDKVRWYLNHNQEREQIAAKGRAEVHVKHTYAHRMQEILRVVSSVPVTTQARVAETTNSARVRRSSPHFSDEKDLHYYNFARPEILELVPRSARRILDIGCGAGALGASIKQRQDCYVVGFEAVPEIATRASDVLDEVQCGDIESDKIHFQDGEFDCVVCGDVLEHLRDPWKVICKIRRWLKTDGTFIASIPNVQNHTVLASLLGGDWTYEPAGLMDRDHVRFFTRREIERMFFRAEFSITSLGIVPGPGHTEWEKAGRPGAVKVGGLHISGLSPDDAESFFAYQFLVAAKPMNLAPFGKTSIVIVTFDQRQLLLECLSSIRERTTEDIEIIVVDNGSTDGTVEALRRHKDVRLIQNPKNLGFPIAANRGIQASTGNQILLLNNDTIVTTAWLTRMLVALYRDPKIGLVGPCSNNVSGEQQIAADYDSLAKLERFSWEFGKANNGIIQQTDRLVGFCLLFRRKLIDEIGLLDERFGIGNFEDDDFTRRATNAGYRAVIARDSFVHHYGHVTFDAIGANLPEILARNQQLFMEKWKTGGASTELAKSAAPIRSQSALTVRFDPERGLLLQKRVLLSLCMIVRNNEYCIRECLESIVPYVDEIIVVDTGSTDRTPQICKELGAQVHYMEWPKSFSIARNESLKYATGEWIFWMDSDDVISPENGRRLRDLAYGPHDPQVLGYLMQTHCPGDGPESELNTTCVDQLHMFRNRPDLRFEFHIHEQIIPSIRRVGGDVGSTDIFVTEKNKDKTRDGKLGKVDRDFELLERDLAERGEHPFVLFNLGMTCHDVHRQEEAIDYLNRCIGVSQVNESHLRKAYSYLVESHRSLGQLESALDVCRTGRTLFPEDVELHFHLASLLAEMQRYPEAKTACLELIDAPREWYYSSVIRGLNEFRAKHLLADILKKLGEIESSEKTWRELVEHSPEYREGWSGFGDFLIECWRIDDVETVGRHLLKNARPERPDLSAEAHRLLACAALRRGDGLLAHEHFRTAYSLCPSDELLIETYCKSLFEERRWEEATTVLTHHLTLRPNNASALHNLGAVFRLQGKRIEAIQAYSQSLVLRPKALNTKAELAFAQWDSGLWHEALSNWTDVLNVDPMNQMAMEGIRISQSGSIGTPAESMVTPWPNINPGRQRME